MKENEKQISTNFNGEPNSFTFNNNSDIISDNFSFLNQDSNEMSAKGDGGLRQIYNYCTLQNDDRIITPPDDYVPDKIDSADMEKFKSQREV